MIRHSWRYQVRVHPARLKGASLRLCPGSSNHTNGGSKYLRLPNRPVHFSQPNRVNVSLSSPGTTYKTRDHPSILPIYSLAREPLRVHLRMAPSRPLSTRENDDKHHSETADLKQRKAVPNGRNRATNGHEDDHRHEHEHEHHSHSLFGHSHSHGENGHTHDAEQIIAALKGSSK